MPWGIHGWDHDRAAGLSYYPDRAGAGAAPVGCGAT